ncbi:MAG: 50S ribosomal protein L29 [Planctomycetaceae bacterium]
MSVEAIREKADVELKEQLESLRAELFQAQFRGGADQVEERGRFRKLRREVARLLTVLRERALGVRGQVVIGSGRKERESS